MDLYIIRHAIAEERDASRWPDDSQRPLTNRGRDRFLAVADLLGLIAPRVDVLLSSRYVRAWQTAELLTEHAGWPAPIACPVLEGAPSETVCEALADAQREAFIALVGHEPCLGELVAYLLTGNEAGMEMEFKKGGAVCLRFPVAPSAAGGSLCWCLTPKLASAIGDR
jgi:phosphohistidine phosphatase